MPTHGRYKWSSYLYYAYGYKNDIITENPMYATLGSNPIEQQKAYREYVLTDRVYEDIIDKEFKIKKAVWVSPNRTSVNQW